MDRGLLPTQRAVSGATRAVAPPLALGDRPRPAIVGASQRHSADRGVAGQRSECRSGQGGASQRRTKHHSTGHGTAGAVLTLTDLSLYNPASCGKIKTMSTDLHFDRAPLTEALIDLRVKLPNSVTLETLAKASAGREAQYPTRRNRLYVAGQLSIDPDSPPATGNRTHIGYDFASRDERYVVQIRLDGFTLSRLEPYENWASFRDEARRWWDIYRSIAQPEMITRAAVRYINRLDIPLPINDLKDFLRTSPEVSPALPQELSGYFMQLHIPQTDINAMLILNEALVDPPSQNPNVVSVLLDIDLFRDSDVPNDEKALWEYFEHLHIRKNEIFLACITKQTEDLIGRSDK
jgi:uncharacterized protein (TIGR04255 family)